MIASNWIPVILRIAFFGCIVLLAALSLLPAMVMTRTSVGGPLEHVVAYQGTAIVMGLAYPKSPRLVVQSALLIAVAAALEAGQLYAPGRRASFQDFAAGAAGVVTGALFLWYARSRILNWLKLD